MILAG